MLDLCGREVKGYWLPRGQGQSLGYFVIFGLIAGSGFVLSDDGGTNKHSPYCEFTEDTIRNLQNNVQTNFPQWDLNCLVLDGCEEINCTMKYLESELKGGLKLNFCKNPPSIYFWKGPFWNDTFKLQDGPQRVEIPHPDDVAVNEGFVGGKMKWFLTVHLKPLSDERVVSLESNLDFCDRASNMSKDNSCSSIQFINLRRFPLSQICEGLITSALAASSPPDMSLDVLHSRDQPSVYSSSSHIGKNCQTHDIFFCGHSATCKRTREGEGICQCIDGFEEDPKGKCIPKKPEPNKPDNIHDDTDTSSSAALGAVIAVFVLISLAGILFFGTKYHIFSRIRNRLHYVRCWPFRRDSARIDHVSMVNPISSSEDDEPPLL